MKDETKLINQQAEQIHTHTDELIDELCEQYKTKLMKMDNEELAGEFADTIGNECRDYESINNFKGKQAIIDYMVDAYSYRLYCKYNPET